MITLNIEDDEAEVMHDALGVAGSHFNKVAKLDPIKVNTDQAEKINKMINNVEKQLDEKARR